MLKEIALDLRRYFTPDRLGSLVQDTASLAIEASDTGSPRVNPHFLIKRGGDYAMAPGKDKRDVKEMYATDGSGTAAGLEIRKLLLTDQVGSTYVWISAPDPWPEARIQIGTKKLTRSKKFEYLKMYDISAPLLSKERCLELGQFLTSISSRELEYPKNTDSLRDLTIKVDIPNNRDPFEYLSTLIDLSENTSWESVLNGAADKNKIRAIRAAGEARNTTIKDPSIIYQSPTFAGAQIEMAMRKAGFGMNPSFFGCGISNTEALTYSSATYLLSVSSEGEATHCPNCSTKLVCGHCKTCNRIVVKKT